MAGKQVAAQVVTGFVLELPEIYPFISIYPRSYSFEDFNRYLRDKSTFLLQTQKELIHLSFTHKGDGIFQFRVFWTVILEVIMMKDRAEKAVETIETTIGDLIEAITQIAMETGKSEEEGYHLASITLEDILRRHQVDLEVNVN